MKYTLIVFISLVSIIFYNCSKNDIPPEEISLTLEETIIGKWYHSQTKNLTRLAENNEWQIEFFNDNSVVSTHAHPNRPDNNGIYTVIDSINTVSIRFTDPKPGVILWRVDDFSEDQFIGILEYDEGPTWQQFERIK